MKILSLLGAMMFFIGGCSTYDIYDKGAKGVAYTEVTNETPVAEQRDCLSKSDYSTVEAISDDQILFHGVGDNVWINHLATRCVGIEAYDALAFEKLGGRLCESDEVIGVDRNLLGLDEGMTCRLGTFDRVYELEREAPES